jgi:hypothetical protein
LNKKPILELGEEFDMKKKTQVITRREFIRTTTQASIAIALGTPLLGQQEKEIVKRASVVLIRHPEATSVEGKIMDSIISEMLDNAIARLYNTENVSVPWKQFIIPEDIVGIKSNEWGPLPTPKALEENIVKHVLETGVDEKNVSVDDRGIRQNPVFKNSTALINIRPMRTHHWSGVGSCLKNYIMFDSQPSKYHPDSCASLGALWHLPQVEGKTRLNILVMLTPLFHGIGPHHWDLKYTWRYNGIIVSTDPVAADTVGLKIIESYRLKYFEKEKPLWPPAKHISQADMKYKVGISDLDKIDLIKLGWDEDILIES